MIPLTDPRTNRRPRLSCKPANIQLAIDAL